MTSWSNQRILETALRQSALDSSCAPEDFLSEHNVIAISKVEPEARKYLTLPFDCQLVSYGNNIVASVRPDLAAPVKRYIDRYPAEHCFETPNLHVLSEELQTYTLQVCFMAEYFLPDLEQLKPLSCDCELRMLLPENFTELYKPEWSNALCEKRRHLDAIGVGAYDCGELVGLAAASADCDAMWQIGVDVLPEHRKRGVASALTSRLALAILERGKAPFYCAAWSNLKSVRNAIRSGFRPAWVELTAKSSEFVAGMNR